MYCGVAGRIAKRGKRLIDARRSRAPPPRRRSRDLSKTRRLASTTRRISGSNGMPPSPRHHATRTPLKSRVRARAGSASHPRGSTAGFAGQGRRSRSGRARRQRPIAPSDPRPRAATRPVDSVGTRPGDGRNPTTLQNAAGLRSDPPVSLPSAIGTMPHANATAAPPLLPPHVFVDVVGIARRAEHGVERLRAGAELRCVRLAARDGAGSAHPRHDQRIARGHVVAIER